MQATQQEYQFHQRICTRGDPIAFAELAEWLYDSLVQDVRKRAGYQADPVLVEEAVGQALLDYHDMPDRYDPSRLSLQSYLVMSAHRDFQNVCAREHRVQAHQISLFDPAFQENDAAGSADSLDEQLDVEELWAIIDETFPDPVERGIVDLIVNHEHAPEPYIQLLHLDALPGDEQIKQAKLAQYRIARRLRRTLTRWLTRTGEEAQ
jgi:hypothetical protein